LFANYSATKLPHDCVVSKLIKPKTATIAKHPFHWLGLPGYLGLCILSALNQHSCAVLNSFTAEIWDANNRPILRGFITSNQTVLVILKGQALSYSWRVVIPGEPGVSLKLEISRFKYLDINIPSIAKIVLKKPITAAGIKPLRRSPFYPPFKGDVFSALIIAPDFHRGCSSAITEAKVYFVNQETIRILAYGSCARYDGSVLVVEDRKTYRLLGIATSGSAKYDMTHIPREHWHSSD